MIYHRDPTSPVVPDDRPRRGTVCDIYIALGPPNRQTVYHATGRRFTHQSWWRCGCVVEYADNREIIGWHRCPRHGRTASSLWYIAPLKTERVKQIASETTNVVALVFGLREAAVDYGRHLAHVPSRGYDEDRDRLLEEQIRLEELTVAVIDACCEDPSF